MPYQTNIALVLTPRITQRYLVNPAHRRRQAGKSRWIITVDEEVECFITSQTLRWVEVSTAWGVIQNGNSLLVLGLSSNNISLKLAKFVDSDGKDLWHGYPADFVKNNQDRPGMVTLQDWKTRGFIEKHHMIKIRKGKECNL
ncbi:MAG: hypothetical protein NTY07_12805 [Bacteroidia bacterium]|nr:hypothetical protein [Bacteroidia bacterium]